MSANELRKINVKNGTYNVIDKKSYKIFLRID